MDKLGQKTSEKSWNNTHFSHKIGVTKIVNIFFSHKYLILVTKNDVISHFHPTNHYFFHKNIFQDIFASDKGKTRPESKLKYVRKTAAWEGSGFYLLYYIVRNQVSQSKESEARGQIRLQSEA